MTISPGIVGKPGSREKQILWGFDGVQTQFTKWKGRGGDGLVPGSWRFVSDKQGTSRPWPP
jgi:hypothetical protein